MRYCFVFDGDFKSSHEVLNVANFAVYRPIPILDPATHRSTLASKSVMGITKMKLNNEYEGNPPQGVHLNEINRNRIILS